MKNLLVLLAFLFSVNALASMSHKSGIGAEPSETKKELAHGCFSEALSSGCHSPGEDRQSFRECVRDKLDTFSPECQTFISRLYGRRK